ncbi:MAG: hypothetical protein ACFFAQ_14805 [Promethearchaeota archaeon]
MEYIQEVEEQEIFDPLDYLHKILKLMILVWKFKWKRFWYKNKLKDKERSIFRIFGKLKGKQPVKIRDERTQKERQIIFYSLNSLSGLFFIHLFRFFKKVIIKLLFDKNYYYPTKDLIERNNLFQDENFPCMSRKKFQSLGRTTKKWIKVINIENQFNETIDFLYNRTKYLENKTFHICVSQRKQKLKKEIAFNLSEYRSEYKEKDYIEVFINSIVPRKPNKPFDRTIWVLFLTAYIAWLIVLFFILPLFIFPGASVYTGNPIIFEMLTSQIPILVFFICIYLLFQKFQKCILFTEDNYDERLKVSEDKIPHSFRMRYELRLASHNTAGFALAFLIGFLAYSIPYYLIALFTRFDGNILEAWDFINKKFFIDDILILWCINVAFWVVAIYIIAMLVFAQYHISKDFVFLFSRFQSPNIDSKLRDYIKTIAFYLLTTSLIIFGSGFIYFSSRQLNLIIIISLTLGILIVVAILFLIFLIGWKRKIVAQKIVKLNDIKTRRNELIMKLQTEEKFTEFKMHEFKDLSELNFLHDQYIAIYEIRAWFFDAKVFFSIIISVATAIPELIANIPF